MGRMLLRPRWAMGLLLVVVVVVSFVRLGFWQLHRLQERRDYAALVQARLAQPPTPLPAAIGGDATYRRVRVVGTFDTDHEVILYGRTQGEQTGNHVLTPFRLADGTSIAVDRGWVPLSDDEPPLTDAAPSAGEISVTGILLPSEVLGTADPEAEPRTTFAKVDLPGLAGQLSYPLDTKVYLLLDTPAPRAGGLPEPASLPDPAAGPPHLSYAIQWFSFATIAVIGFVLLLRREGRRTTAV